MSSSNTRRLGLSLSGGGYRATAFHLGTLRKLHSMGLLGKVDVLSTISGGSITGAYYCLNKDNFAQFDKDLYTKLQTKNVIRKVLLSWTFIRFVGIVLLFLVPAFYCLFTNRPWLFLLLFVLFFVALFLFQFLLFPVSKRIEKIYDQFFFAKKKLSHLPERPLLVVGSTNLQTARAFTFSRDWMQDSTYQYMQPSIRFKAADFPVARAVMASSCVPFAFTPIKIDKQFFATPADYDRVHPVLVDGGVYDNQGIHRVMQSGKYACHFVITSDAGCGNDKESRFRNTFQLLLETVNVFMSRIKKVQMVQDVYNNASTAQREIAYFSLGWDVENCIGGFIRNLAAGQIAPAVIQAHQLRPEWVEDPLKHEMVIQEYLEIRTNYATIPKPGEDQKKIARSVGTNLTALSKAQVDSLILQAEALAELQVKLYCPSIISPI